MPRIELRNVRDLADFQQPYPAKIIVTDVSEHVVRLLFFAQPKLHRLVLLQHLAGEPLDVSIRDARVFQDGKRLEGRYNWLYSRTENHKGRVSVTSLCLVSSETASSELLYGARGDLYRELLNRI